MKTQQEIRTRFDEVSASGDDVFGFRQEALVNAMEYATVADLLKEGVTEDQWDSPNIEATARDYLGFAIGKAVGHRGISAGRSIEKLAEWVWCLGDADLAERFESAGYEPYGAPKLAVLAQAWGMATDDMESAEWQRMASGQPCREYCDEGCTS